MIYNIPFIAVAALILIGLYAVIFKRNLIKIVIGITLIESGVNLFLITLGYRENSIAPIYTSSSGGIMSLPVPQALTLTSIVISSINSYQYCNWCSCSCTDAFSDYSYL